MRIESEHAGDKVNLAIGRSGHLAIDNLMSYLLLKDSHSTDRITIVIPRPDDNDTLFGIRCPQCSWQPSASSRWCCWCGQGTPEPFFFACGTSWNTFLTQGLCPGCSHQWHWTTCLQCHESSPHVDWYEDDPGAPPRTS